MPGVSEQSCEEQPPTKHFFGAGVGMGVVMTAGSVDVATGSGHFANSQFGPSLPTALPSGHTIASLVQATGLFSGCCRDIVTPTIASNAMIIMTIKDDFIELV